MNAAPELGRGQRVQTRLEVLPGVFFDQITTLQRCDEILEELMMSIPSIENQIDMAKVGVSDRTDDRTWLPRAKHALRLRKLCMPKLQQLRAQLAKQERAGVTAGHMVAPRRDMEHRDRIFVEIVWEIAPEIAGRAKILARERHPDVFGGPAEDGAPT